MRDSMYDDTTARPSLNIGLRTNGTVSGTAVDLVGTANFFRAAMLIVIAGAVTDGSHQVSLEVSDTGVGGWTAAPAAHVQGTIAAITTANANTVQRLAYDGPARYLRASVTTSGATTGGQTGALVLLSRGSGVNPVT